MINVFPTPTHIVSKPFLRWVGGKTRLLPILKKALPPGQRLIEPFVGSATVFLGTTYSRYLLNDANPDLINLYQWIRRDIKKFIKFAKPLFFGQHPDDDTYIRVRDAFNKASAHSLERAILFLWLNKTCFNGVCRYNDKGQFNVPRGNNKGPLFFPEEDILSFHAKSKFAEFRNGDFLDVLMEAGPGDVVYADPPYIPRSVTASFTRYTQNDYTLERQAELAEACRRAAERGAVVILSNSDTETTREIYHDAQLVKVRVTHLVGSKKEARTTNNEVLLLYSKTTPTEFWSMAKTAKTNTKRQYQNTMSFLEKRNEEEKEHCPQF